MKENREQFDNRMFQQEDPKPAKDAADKLDTRKFWFVCVPLGAVVAFVASLVAQSGGVFLPCWVVVSLLIWGGMSGLGEKR